MSKRYVLVVQVECDETGRLLHLPDEGGRIGERDIEDIEGPIAFVRYGIVDRGRQNKTVHSGYSLAEVAATQQRFNEEVDRRRAEREEVVVEPAVVAKTMTA